MLYRCLVTRKISANTNMPFTIRNIETAIKIILNLLRISFALIEIVNNTIPNIKPNIPEITISALINDLQFSKLFV